MRILIGYNRGVAPGTHDADYEAWSRRLRKAGLDVDIFCLSVGKLRGALPWKELDTRWKRGESHLMKLYDALLKKLDGFDAFVNYNGANIHPEFVRSLGTTTVFSCFDDPEASDQLSKPAAAAYDLAMVGNVAEVERYREWDAREVHWWPLGFRVDDYNPLLTQEDIRAGEREIPVALLCERTAPYRRQRLDKFTAKFPEGKYYGRGWPDGFLPEAERVPLLQKTKIGINIHNSTGPVNFRTYYLPANGVLQICDNKGHLARIFDVGKEVVGYDSIEEAIELCAYYLNHDEERKAIAVAGWKRTIRDYNEVACFRRVVGILENRQNMNPCEPKRVDAISLQRHRKRTTPRRVGYGLLLPLTWPLSMAGRIVHKIKLMRTVRVSI